MTCPVSAQRWQTARTWAARLARVVAASALACAGLVSSPNAGTVAASRTATPPTPGSPYIGVWTGGPSTSEGAVLDDLDAGWARATVYWSGVEPTSGTFAWTSLDQAMASAAGLNGHRSVLAQVRNNPAWAAASPCTLTTPLEQQHLASFVATLAARYPGVVWQLYNEMDNTSPAVDAQLGLGGCFGTRVPNGSPTPQGRVDYAHTLEAVNTAIKTADPTGQLATGGVASGGFTDSPGGNFDRGFLPGVMAQLKLDAHLNAVDFVTVHYYSSQAGTYAAAGVDLLGRVAQLRLDIVAAGLLGSELKPVISDELSYTDLNGLTNASAFNAAQRAYVPKVLARAAASNMRAAIWFWVQDASSGLGADNTYGLRDVNGVPKPAYRAMKYFTSVVSREDQFVRALDLSAVSDNLEGYQFAAGGGKTLQLVWNQTNATTIAYTPPGTIASVTDAIVPGGV